MLLKLDAIKELREKCGMYVSQLLDVHEYDLLITFFDSGDRPNEILPQPIQNIHVIGFGLQKFQQAKISFFFGFKFPILLQSSSASVLQLGSSLVMMTR